MVAHIEYSIIKAREQLGFAMPISMKMLSGGADHEELEFGDDVLEIRIGRSPDCHIQLDEDDTSISRLHLTLKKSGARYVAEPQMRDTFVDGKRLLFGDPLPPKGTLKLGEACNIRFTCEAAGKETNDEFRPVKPIGRVLKNVKHRIAVIGAVASLAIAGLAAVYIWVGEIDDVVEKRINAHQRATAKDLQKLQARLSWQKKLKDAKKAIFLVLLCEPDDKHCKKSGHPMGTAWVVDRAGKFVTNLHVVDVEKWPSRLRNHRIWLRGTDETNHLTLEVVSIRKHPAAHQFAEDRVNFFGSASTRRIRFGAAALAIFDHPYDLALLTVNLGPGVGLHKLEVAARPDLVQLSPTTQVMSWGFPIHRAVGGGVNVAEPEPKFRMGTITSVTDYFLKTGRDAKARHRRHLVLHSLEGTKGMSGSPIFGRDGKVVAVYSGGNIETVVLGADRKLSFPSALGDRFAHRADLVGELVAGTNTKRLERRRKRWKEEFGRQVDISKVLVQRFYGPGASVKAPLVDLKLKWNTTGRVVKGLAVARFVFELRDPRRILIQASPANIVRRIEVKLLRADGARVAKSAPDNPRHPLPEVEVQFLPPGRYHVVVSTLKAGALEPFLDRPLPIKVFTDAPRKGGGLLAGKKK